MKIKLPYHSGIPSNRKGELYGGYLPPGVAQSWYLLPPRGDDNIHYSLFIVHY